MTRTSFKQILERYLNNTCSEDERQTVEKWYELLDQEVKLPQTEAEWKLIETKLWNRINGVAEEPTFVWLRPVYRYGIAASIVLLLGFSFWFLSNSKSSVEKAIVSNDNFEETINNTKQIKRITLEDGSVVSLYPQAKISYPKQFLAEKREVSLNGDAFFDIMPNPERPFLVLAGNTVTKVLGTSFLVKATKNSKIIVEVKTGKVTVYEKNKIEKQENGVILSPNQKVTFYDEQDHFITGIVEKPEVIEQKKIVYDFDFNNITLREATEILEKAYGIDIVIENESLGNCTLVGNLNDLDYFMQLEMICRSLNASYEVKGTNILISGKGCN